jgi:hypothetical protein
MKQTCPKKELETYPQYWHELKLKTMTVEDLDITVCFLRAFAVVCFDSYDMVYFLC